MTNTSKTLIQSQPVYMVLVTHDRDHCMFEFGCVYLLKLYSAVCFVRQFGQVKQHFDLGLTDSSGRHASILLYENIHNFSYMSLSTWLKHQLLNKNLVLLEELFPCEGRKIQLRYYCMYTVQYICMIQVIFCAQYKLIQH